VICPHNFSLIRAGYNLFMWAPAFWFGAVSIGLWQYANAAFMPELLAFRLIRVLPVESSAAVQAVLIIVSVVYFAVYLAVSLGWGRLKPFFGNSFYVSLLLLAINVLILFPVAGKGVFGYAEPPGAFQACLFLLVSHWVFAQTLQQKTATPRR
jgi:hypothetical protein